MGQLVSHGTASRVKGAESADARGTASERACGNNEVEERQMAGDYRDEFGFIPIELEIEFGAGRVSTAPTFQNAIETVRAESHNGFYEPIAVTWTRGPDREWEPVPGSEQPAFLFRVPATHSLLLHERGTDREEARRGNAAFIIHFLGFLHGFRAQFSDWRFDGRLPLGEKPDTILYGRDLPYFIDTAHNTWLDLPPRQQMLTTNALYMHSRAPTYRWAWERFVAEYQVVDSIFAVLDKTAQPRPKVTQHKERIAFLCQQFGLRRNTEWEARFVKLRNELFHEALWDNAAPQSDGSTDAAVAPHRLHALTRRTLLALLGIRADYIHSSWFDRQRHLFRPRR
jgi:hypothetical protein